MAPRCQGVDSSCLTAPPILRGLLPPQGPGRLPPPCLRSRQNGEGRREACGLQLKGRSQSSQHCARCPQAGTCTRPKLVGRKEAGPRAWLKTEGYREESRCGGLVSSGKKRFSCFVINLTMLWGLASKQPLLCPFLSPLILRTERRFCRQTSHDSQTIGFNLQGG